jgi:hypothetical protein
MTGRCYYVTTIGNWKRHAGSFANSHWLLLAPDSENDQELRDTPSAKGKVPPSIERVSDTARIIVLVEADEGTHGLLEDDPSFTALPHPLSSKPIPSVLRSALAKDGVSPGASTFEIAETMSRSHPLLRHRVF